MPLGILSYPTAFGVALLALIARIARVEHLAYLKTITNARQQSGKTFITDTVAKMLEEESNATTSLRREADRNIKDAVRYMLWGRSAGRCQFDGCNKAVWKSEVTQEILNLAEAAHIYSFNEGGPRGNEGINLDLINDTENLLLVCRGCHKLIDDRGTEYRYQVDLLRSWKRSHEDRIELVTEIAPNKKSHVILYGAAIDNVDISVDVNQASNAMFPRRYPADRHPILLGTVGQADRDSEPDFWTTQARALKRNFQQRVAERLQAGQIQHLSVFALAPQPLLILLGTLLVDLVDADIYQRHREPNPSWSWPDHSKAVDFQVHRPEHPLAGTVPVLVLSLSANVGRERIIPSVKGTPEIWEVTADGPNNDIIKSPTDLSNFRKTVRPVFDEIKLIHGQNTPLHIFPAAPASCSVELGRIRMPKAHQPWIIYDQNNRAKRFIPVLQIGDDEA